MNPKSSQHPLSPGPLSLGHYYAIFEAAYEAYLQGRDDEATRLYDSILPGAPDPQAQLLLHWNIAQTLLRSGNFARGWVEFEWRLKMSSYQLAKPFAQPQWTGQDLTGKTILLHIEGGCGDAIHFCRYVPMVAKTGARVLLQCQAELIGMLSQLDGITTIYSREQELPLTDFHSSTSSLPGLFGTTLDTVPASVPYLKPDSQNVQQWAQWLGKTDLLRVGLCWAGSANSADLRSRSVSIFGPLAGVRPVEFHSLQFGEDALQFRPPGLNVIDHSARLGDFSQTAALAANMDVIISVDTSIAHLGGAMAMPTWVMIPGLCDFRWMLNRTDSPWYPTMRLFRQKIGVKDWNQVVSEIAGGLRKLIVEHAGLKNTRPRR